MVRVYYLKFKISIIIEPIRFSILRKFNTFISCGGFRQFYFKDLIFVDELKLFLSPLSLPSNVEPLAGVINSIINIKIGYRLSTAKIKKQRMDFDKSIEDRIKPGIPPCGWIGGGNQPLE